MIVSFLNFIFIKGEESATVLNNNNHSVGLSLPSSFVEQNKDLKHEDFTLTLFVRQPNQFIIEVEFSPVYRYYLDLRINQDQSSFTKVINIKTKFMDDTESNHVNPVPVIILFKLKLIEIEFETHDKVIFSNEHLEEKDPVTHENKIFNGFYKKLYRDGVHFTNKSLKELIFPNSITSVTQISTLEKNNDQTPHPFNSIPESFSYSVNENNDHNLQQLSSMHQNQFPRKYYFLIIPVAMILIICLIIFLFWFKK
ncbi:hypothetical protein [Candidatus Phytoplasma mali]|uniref:hypothetical protein n=1 Tax=Apple proliferation phytoplasma TaxID=37692 RepID=UPI0011D0DF94|nr:hypothetical protein [Candidatus Phytoplasma mali]